MSSTPPEHAQAPTPGPATLLRHWPWLISGIAWVLVAGVLTLFRRDFTGIEGFSSSNYGWLGFTTIGGCIFAWRLAAPGPRLWGLVRPILAAAIAFAMCVLAIVAMGFLFLPQHPLQGAGDTLGPLGGALNPLGRAELVAILVLPFGYLAELVRSGSALLGRGSRSRGVASPAGPR
ncbi:MAG: hypothetical protein ACREQM_17840 [Candidatus Dormibacteraceae bacterium]